MSYFAIAAAAIALVAGVAEGQAQKQAGKANQKIAENNAKLAEQDAKDSSILAARESQQETWKTRAIIGQQRAAIAANGIDSDSGSAYDALNETALFGGANKSAIAQDAARKAWGYQAQALDYRNQGKQAAWNGKVQGQTTMLRAVGSAVGSYGSIKGGKSPGYGGTAGQRPYMASAPTTSSGASWLNAYGAGG